MSYAYLFDTAWFLLVSWGVTLLAMAWRAFRPELLPQTVSRSPEDDSH